MSKLIAQGEDYERRWYSYGEIREIYNLPKGPIDVPALSRQLSDHAHTATAGNCGETAENDGEGIVITVTW